MAGVVVLKVAHYLLGHQEEAGSVLIAVLLPAALHVV